MRLLSHCLVLFFALLMPFDVFLERRALDVRASLCGYETLDCGPEAKLIEEYSLSFILHTRTGSVLPKMVRTLEYD